LKKEVFKYLKDYSTDTTTINRLIVSAFIEINGLEIKNCSLIKKNEILESDELGIKHKTDFVNIFRKNSLQFNFEDLIELFEFVISPADKIINGTVYTPKFIRDFIVNETLKSINKHVDKALFADLSCGCGAFLFTIAVRIHEQTGIPYTSIFNRIYGLDITEYSIERTKILLALLALSNGEDPSEFTFNIFCGNALEFDLKNVSPIVKNNGGFDVIVGNPPYVCSRNMDSKSIRLLEKWSVTKSGHPDLYIPFFQVGFENLSANGILGYITVNTFLKSINGRALRQYFADHQIGLKIISFGGEQIFKDRNTYTCLCFLHKEAGGISYKLSISSELNNLKDNDFYFYEYELLNNLDGWNLADSIKIREFIQRLESTGIPFKNKYITRNGIATLKNDIYKFIPSEVADKEFYLMESDGKEYKIEKSICRDIINANKIKTEADLYTKREKIIYPYYQINGLTKLIKEVEFQHEYPYAYKYLYVHKRELAKRDKGNQEYENWYAYGRRQSLDLHSFKLFFPHICERPTFIISEDKELLFYNGIAIISNNIEELEIAKRILESDIFFNYIRLTTKDYSSGFISMSKNYLKNFGILELSESEKNRLLTGKNSDALLNSLYKLNGSLPF
jgi:adenine-specific DNA-methyltransferase